MKNTFVIAAAIIIGFLLHGLLTKPADTPDVNKPKPDRSGRYGKYRDILEYKTVSAFKQAAIDQLSELQAKVLHINGKDYYYIFLVDEDEDGKGMNWDHQLFELKNDSLIEVPIE